MHAARQLLCATLLGGVLLLPACEPQTAGNSPATPGGSESGVAGSPEAGRDPKTGRDLEPPDSGEPVRSPESLKAVETVRAARLTGDAALEIPSTLAVDRDVELMSRLTGVIEEIRVERGQRVGKGEVLARLDNRDLALEAESQEKAYLLARVEFERAKSLSETRVISPQEYDAKRLGAERAEADWKRAQVELEKSFMRAPFDGVVSERYARLGQRVVQDDNAPLFRITALEPLLARFYLPEARLGELRVGDAVTARASTGPARDYEGRVIWISPVVDAASGTFQVLAEVIRPAGDPLLRPGLSVKVRLPLDAGRAAPAVQRAALSGGESLLEGSQARLFVVEEGRAILRLVRVGATRDQQVEILSGLMEGDQVILPFPSDLADGQPVRVALSR